MEAKSSKKRTFEAEPKVLKRRKVDDKPPVWYVCFPYLWGLPNTYLRGDVKEDLSNSKVMGTTLGSKLQKDLCLPFSGHMKFQLVIGHEDDEEVVRQHNS